MATWLPLLPLVVAFVAYPCAAWLCLQRLPGAWRMRGLAACNLVGTAVLCLVGGLHGVRMKQLPVYLQVALVFFGLYLAGVIAQYALLRWSAAREWRGAPATFLLPIVLLAFVKYVPNQWNPLHHLLGPFADKHFAEFFAGISYMAFRLSHMALEVRNDVAPMPGPAEYLGFAFFVPTFLVGPISPYSWFQRSVGLQPDKRRIPLGASSLRIIVGFTKYLFIATLLNQFTYAGLLMDGHPHGWQDLAVAVVAYCLYLYCNFSGFIDMAIGTAGLLGIEVHENFDRPFLSRDIQEFWTRWHITLSMYLRDVMFVPMTKALARRLAPKYTNHVIAFSSVVVFLVVGIWHGVGLNFAIFGLLQGIGLAACHYYTVFLKRRLGKKGYAAYQANVPLRAIATAVTFLYFSATLFFFANTFDDMRKLASVIL